MTEKYFTPEETDFRVGMEYETEEDELRGIWEKHIVENLYDLETISRLNQKYIGKYANIRMQYLTKEQIEAEGWIPITEGNIDQWYRDDKHLALKLYYNLGPKQDKIIIRIWQEISHGNQLFLGECKCINTFRYICKLIGI